MLSEKKLLKYWKSIKEKKPELFSKLTQLNRQEITNAMFESWKIKQIELSDWDGEAYCIEMMEFVSGAFGIDEYIQITDYVNSQNNVYCVYIWYMIDEAEVEIPFYVGKGNKHRAKNIRNRSNEFRRIYETYVCHYKVIEKDLSEYKALVLENELINHFRSQNIKLVNKTKPRNSYQIF